MTETVRGILCQYRASEAKILGINKGSCGLWSPAPMCYLWVLDCNMAPESKMAENSDGFEAGS